MLAQVTQFLSPGPALKSPVDLSHGLMGTVVSLNRHLLNMITCQTGRWPGRAVSHKHLCRLQWGRPTPDHDSTRSLRVHKGLLDRVKDTSLPGKGNGTGKGWEFHRAGVPSSREPHSTASVIQRRISQTNSTLLLYSHQEDRNLAFGIRHELEALPSRLCFLSLFPPL